MKHYEFISPTKIIFGDDTNEIIGSTLKKCDFNNIVFVYGKNSIFKSGLYEKITKQLNDNKINYYEVSGVEANPKLSLVKKAISFLKDKPIDAILACGGGSVIDTAKLLSQAIYYDGDPFDFNLGIAKPKMGIPVVTILTISAAGSELSDSCVITNDEVTPFIKKGFNTDFNRPFLAFLNPINTFSVSKFQTGCGIVDIMMHTLERYMNPLDDCDLSENFGIGLLKTVLKYGKIAIAEPNNYEAREQLMLASSYSHNGLTGLLKKQGMRVHGMEHILSGFYDEVAHGAGLAILWPAWCYYVLDNPRANKLLARLAKELFNLDSAKEGIEALKNYFKEIGMPVSFKDLKLNKPLDIEKMALAYSANKTKVTKDFKDLDYNAFIEIFKLGE